MAGVAQQQPVEAPSETDDFERQVQVAQHDLETSITRATLRHDPYRHVLTALAGAVGLFPAMIRELRSAASPRQPIDQETLTELGRTSLILLERQGGELLRTRMRRWALSLSIALFAIGLGGFGLGWFAHGSALERECMARGSIQNAPDSKRRFCAFWLDPAPPAKAH
jgi:hypothetical protein